jgi:hypothetical protein
LVRYRSFRYGCLTGSSEASKKFIQLSLRTFSVRRFMVCVCVCVCVCAREAGTRLSIELPTTAVGIEWTCCALRHNLRRWTKRTTWVVCAKQRIFFIVCVCVCVSVTLVSMQRHLNYRCLTGSSLSPHYIHRAWQFIPLFLVVTPLLTDALTRTSGISTSYHLYNDPGIN